MEWNQYDQRFNFYLCTHVSSSNFLGAAFDICDKLMSCIKKSTLNLPTFVNETDTWMVFCECIVLAISLLLPWCLFHFIYATRYSKGVLVAARIIKTVNFKSIAYLLLQVILTRCLHLSTVLLFKVVITKRAMKQQRNHVLLMLRLLQSHLLRCWINTTILHYIHCVSQWSAKQYLVGLDLINFVDAVLCIVVGGIS